MNEQLRYRLTGGLLLFAVVVIFAPMLFDGDDIPPVELAPVDESYVPPSVEHFDEVVPGSDFINQAQKLREQADDEGFHRQTRTKIGEPVLSAPDGSTEAWAVQLGSFADADKARALRDRLRADGNEAFISRHKPEGAGIVSRVAVGPLLDRDHARQLVEDLSARYALQARLMAFGN